MKTKSKFVFLHLLVSCVIAILSVIVVFYFWYPTPLSKAVGITHIFLMMLAIDVIVGPLLGWFVYKEGKKSLKFDIGVIIIIQAVALSYGIYSIAQARPAWIVFNVDRFEMIKNNELVYSNRPNISKEYISASYFGAKFVAIKQIKDKKTRQEYMMQEIFNGVSIAQRPELYQAINIKSVQQKLLDLKALNGINNPKNVKLILNKNPLANAWLPLQTRGVDMVVLINKEKGEVVKIVDLRPWK